MLQVIFHGVDRSPAAEADIAARFDALKKFDNRLTECKATISKVGELAGGKFSVKLDLKSAGVSNLIVEEQDPVVGVAINKVFDSVRRVVKDENEKRRRH